MLLFMDYFNISLDKGISFNLFQVLKQLNIILLYVIFYHSLTSIGSSVSMIFVSKFSNAGSITDDEKYFV